MILPAYNILPVKNNIKTFATNGFERRNLSFLGAESRLQEVKFGRIPTCFTQAINEKINKTPNFIISLLKENDYKLYLTDDLNLLTHKYGVLKSGAKESLGFTYSNPKTKENFIAFSTNLPMNSIDCVVNHEIGHALSYIFQFGTADKYKKLIAQDINDIKSNRKLDALTLQERSLVFSSLLNSSNINSCLDEIVADLIAWKLGCGCYGSELSLDKQNPSFMPFLFPKTYKSISNENLFKVE